MNHLINQALKKELYRRSFYHFFVEAFKNELDPTTIYKDNWHVKVICDLAQSEIERIVKGEKKKGDILINILPRSLKSLIMSVALNAWAWIDHPELKFISVSHSHTLSLSLSGDTLRLIESDWYQSFFSDSFDPDSKDWGKGRFRNSKGGIRIAKSVGSKILGEGADVIVIDDPQDPSGSGGEAERIQVIEYNDKTLSSRLNDKEIGVFFLIMQRLHQSDLSGHWLKRKKNLTHYQFPARLKENDVIPKECEKYYVDGLFFPSRFSNEWLDSAKIDLGSTGYANQYGQRASASEGNIFLKKWFRYFHLQDLPDLTWYYTIDSAYGEDKSQSLAVRKRKDPDFNAVMVFAKHENNLYLRKVGKNKLIFPDFCQWLDSFVRSNGYTDKSIIHVEPKASGKSIVQQMKKETDLNIKEYESDTLRDSKETRAKAQSPKVESGRVFLLASEDWDEFIENAGMFPNIVHDDDIDAWIMSMEIAFRPLTAPILTFV